MNITETIGTDVIVCGAGTSGIITAIAAAQSGAGVVLLEKKDTCYPPRQMIGAVNSTAQRKFGIAIDRNEIVNELCRYACYRIDQRLVNLWADESGEMMDWLEGIMTKHGLEIYVETDIRKNRAFKEWPTCHSFYSNDPDDTLADFRALTSELNDLNVKVMTNTPMVSLITEHEEVTGVIARKGDDEYIRINAEKGVVLATGGYSNNVEMLREINPVAYSNTAEIFPNPEVTGDGIRVATMVGAVLDPIPTAMIFDRAAVLPGSVCAPTPDAKIFWLGSQPFLRVNRFGERFANESVPYDFGVHAASLQPGRVWCSVFDSNWKEHVLDFHTIGCSRVVSPELRSKYPVNFDLNIMTVMHEGLVISGHMKQADTIEELAEMLMIPKDALVKTVGRYNELCGKGVDVDFGKESSRMRPVKAPPFYGITLGGLLLCTLDGLRINTDMQVLDSNFRPIEGLYAVGNDSGGFFAYTYPELIPGVSAGRSMTFGRHVGNYLARI
jgi:fumarate reductase flavoprotein subunit